MTKLSRVFLGLLILASSVFGQIIEVKKMSEILEAITSNSVVVFDLDNTIMEASQMLGSDQWFEHRIKQLEKNGISLNEAVATAVGEWVKINEKGKVHLVEETTPSIVKEIQDAGIPTMGLTARPTIFIQNSLEQLEQLGVPLHRRTLSQETIDIEGNKEKAIFQDGLMSVGANNKGVVLVALLNKIGIRPERIIFVDDKQKNVANVDKALNEALIPSFAFRYGYADKKVTAFDAELADFQYNYFFEKGIVLSDEEARQLIGDGFEAKVVNQ